MTCRKKKPAPCPYYIGQGEKRIICKDRCFAQFVSEIEKNRYYRSRCILRRRKCNIFEAITERERRKVGAKNEL